MLYMMRLDVNIPPGADATFIAEREEMARQAGEKLQRSGEWRHVWRIAGKYAFFIVVDVENHNALHEIVMSLPFYPAYLDVTVTPLAEYPRVELTD